MINRSENNDDTVVVTWTFRMGTAVVVKEHSAREVDGERRQAREGGERTGSVDLSSHAKAVS